MAAICFSWFTIVLRSIYNLPSFCKSQKSSHCLFLFFLCFLCNVGTCLDSSTPSLTDPAAAAALNKLLENVTFHIPDFSVQASGFTMNISKFYCNHISLQDFIMQDSFQTDNALAISTKTDTLDVEVKDLAISCNGHFDVRNGILHFKGNIDAEIEKSTIQTIIGFMLNDLLAPEEAKMKTCAVSLKFKKLSLSGSILAYIADIFVPIIKIALQNNIKSLVCTPIQPLVDTNLTAALQKYDSLVELFALPEKLDPREEIDKVAGKKVDYNKMSGLTHALEKILGATAHNNKYMLNNVIDEYLLTDGSIEMEVNKTIHIGDDGLTETNVTIDTVSIKGLDTLSHIELLYNTTKEYPNAKTNYSLGLRLQIDELLIYLNGSVSLSPSSIVVHGDGDVVLPAGALVNLTGVSFDTLLEVPILEDHASNMNIGNLMHHLLFCIVDMVDMKDVQFRLMDIKMQDLRIDFDRFAGVAPLFNEITDTALDLMVPSAVQILRGVVEKIGVNYINDKISNLPDVGFLCERDAWIALEENAEIFDLFEEESHAAWPTKNKYDYLTLQQQSQFLFDLFSAESEYEVESVLASPPNVRIPNYSHVKKINKNEEKKLMITANSNPKIEFEKEKTEIYDDEKLLKTEEVGNEDKYIDFQDSSIWGMLDFILDELIGINSPVSYNIDDVIDTFINLGAWNKTDVLNKVLKLSLEGLSEVKIKINEISMHGLDTFDNFTLFLPIDKTELHSKIDIANLHLFLDFELELQGNGINSGRGTIDHLTFNIALKHFAFETFTDVLLRKEDFYNQTLSEFVDCALQNFDQIHFRDFMLSMESIGIHVECVDDVCSDGWKELGKVWDEHAGALNKAIQKGLEYLFNEEDGSFVRGLNKMLENKVGKTCDPAPEKSEDQTLRHIVTIATIVIGICVLMVVFYFLRRCYMKEKYGLNSGSGGYNPLDESLTEHTYWKKESTLMYSPKVPNWIRYGMPPFLAFCGHAVFFAANFTPGCGINVKVKLAGDEIMLENVFQMSLLQTVTDMWSAGVYPLSLLIGFLSGLWPHIKLIVMMMCWVLPFPETERGLCMLWLDALGKWGLVDVYVLVLCMASFSFNIAPNEVNYLPDEFVRIQVIAEPRISIFLFIIALIVSLIATHVITHYHREEIQRKHLEDVPYDQEKKESLRTHRFKCFEGDGDKTTVKISHLGSILIFILIGFTAVAFGYGSGVDSFRFEYQGLIRYVIDPIQNYSFFGVAEGVLSSNEYSFPAYIIFLVFVIFAFTLPILSLILCIFLFIIPLSQRAQKRLFTLVECLFAWSSIEVFLVAVIAAMLEINRYAQFVFAAAQPLDPLMKFVLPEGASEGLFVIGTDFDSGCWFLWGAMAGWVICLQTIVRLAERSLRDRRGLTEVLWNTKEHETCCEDTLGFQVLQCLRLVSVKNNRASFTSVQGDFVPV